MTMVHRHKQGTVSGDLADGPSVSIVKERYEARVSKNAQLQLWPEGIRGVPNTLLRSALFGAVGRGPRPYMERKEIASLREIAILYAGQRLTQSDLDAWTGVLHLARCVPLGECIEFSEKGFLRLIGRGGDAGRSLGKSDRLWLRKVFARLSANTVEVKHGVMEYAGSLIDEYWRDASTGRYSMRLNPKMIRLFGNHSWTGLDWAVRQELTAHPLAQWLHGFYSTHASPYKYRYERIHQLCGSDAGLGARSEARNVQGCQRLARAQPQTRAASSQGCMCQAPAAFRLDH